MSEEPHVERWANAVAWAERFNRKIASGRIAIDEFDGKRLSEPMEITDERITYIGIRNTRFVIAVNNSDFPSSVLNTPIAEWNRKYKTTFYVEDIEP